jgi:DNA-binding transcriptional ArsR family regulator
LPRKSNEATLDRRLIRALGHPVRVRALEVLNVRVASPSELAKELGEPLGNVAYHVKILEENDAIELVRTAPVRGALEHFYRAKVRPWFDTVELDDAAYDEIVQMLDRVVERAHELQGEPATGRAKAPPKELGAHATALMMMQVRRARGRTGHNDGAG